MPYATTRDQLRRQSNNASTPCYFTIKPQSYNHHDPYSHYSIETPHSSPTLSDAGFDILSDPSNPLLAHRIPANPYTPTMLTSPMQLQTSAAHAVRPSPQPVQNVLHVTSDDSNASSSSSDNDVVSSYDSLRSNSCLDTARCSRCQRTASLDPNTGNSNMLQYGLNLWYCTRCASIVGFGR